MVGKKKKEVVAKKTKVAKKITVKSAKKITPKSVKKISLQPEEGVDDGKQKIIDQFSTHAGDTGSPEVQVAILTWKIVNLQKHLEINQKDNHSRRGLLKIVSKRRRIMKYLHDKDEKRYTELEAKIKTYQAANK